ncbi:MAG: UDP-N-acetylglucosamine 2-epimerase, partial [Oscillospiraceae bacterium]
MKKICVVTATRAEYGLLKPLIALIASDSTLELCLLVTGTHLLPTYGNTVAEIEADGFPIVERISFPICSDTPEDISRAMGRGFMAFADAYARHKPDMVVVLGDRYELIPICFCAVNSRIPIAHISGGETTEGAVDEVVRHCVTKMSYLHFPGCEAYRQRIIQLGESPARVFNFGDIGVE